MNTTRLTALPFVLLASLSLSLSAAAAPASVWLDTAPGGARARLDTLLPPADGSEAKVENPAVLVEARAVQGNRVLPVTVQDKSIAIQQAAGGNTADLRFSARTLDADGGLVIYNAKAGRSEVLPSSDLEIVPTEAGGSTFRMYYKGKPVPATIVSVETSAGWRRQVKPSADGSFSLVSAEYPKLFPSRYLLEASAKVGGRFSINGKFMDSATFTSTLVFDVAP